MWDNKEYLNISSIKEIEETDSYQIVYSGLTMHVPKDPGNRHYRMIQRAISEGSVEVEFVPAQDPVERLRDNLSLTFVQLLIGLVTEQWITEQEGEAWLAGNVPTSVNNLISSLPANERFAARARITKPSTIPRKDPLVEALGTAEGKTPEEIDNFFITYRQV